METYLYVVSIGGGLFLLAAALFNWDSLFVDAESRLVELIGGETAVRWYWGLGGVLLIGTAFFYWLRF